MKSPSSRALLVALSLSTSACANVLGLNDLEEVDCVGASCADAAVDGSTDTAIADTIDAAEDGAEVAVDAVVDGADSAADAPTDGGGDAGCEAGIMSCGACDRACSTANVASAVCSGGLCEPTCQAGFGDCTTPAAPTPDDGCETKLDTITNCGACGMKCDTTTSVGAACVGGKCTYTGCKSGFADCVKTGADYDGCETSITTTANCGACGSACDTANSTGATCNGTTCLYTGCIAGKLDCNKTAPNTAGCESNSTSTSSCGGCGNVCSAATGTPSCSGTTCSYACSAGRADCNSATSPDTDGCECPSSSTAATGTVGGCCGTGCQTQHDNGVGQSFYDCVALSTYASTQAIEACKAYTNDATGANCHTIDCGGGTGSTLVVCNDTGTQKCMCWEFKGTYAGYVFVGSAAGACGCPSSKTTAWK